MRSLLALAVSLAAAAPAIAQDALVGTDWVAQNTKSAQVRVVEVSVDPGVYEKGHVPGAVGFKWHTELCDPVSRDVVSKEAFEKLCSKSGITRDTTVVLYGDNNNWFAAWGYWIFTLYGHPDVRLMNGGRTKWELEKRAWDIATPAYAATKYAVDGDPAAIRVRLADVVAALKEKSAEFVDVRSPEEFTGKIIAPPDVKELAIRAGHIPTAKNFPWKRAINDDGTFKSVEELRRAFAELGVDGGKPIITYCRIGERSSHTWFVLSEILGFGNVRNYDGSWTEYGNAVGLPIVNESGTVWTGK